MAAVAPTKKLRRISRQKRQALEAELRDWLIKESEDFDQLVEEGPEIPDEDLWDNLPEIDSKTVARSSPIFKKHLGIPLNVKLIKSGGYDSVEEAIEELVPKMIAEARGQKP